MNDSFGHTRSTRSVVRPMILALALALPGAVAIAVQMGDVVTTRADQNVDEQYGRDSVYASSSGSKQPMPDQSSSVDRLAINSLGDQNAPSFDALSDRKTHVGSGYVGDHVGSGYVGDEEPQGSIAGSTFEQPATDVGLAASSQLAGTPQEAVESQYLVITPLETAMSLPAAASEEEATSEFVIIVPDNSAGEDQSASNDEENSLAVD